VTEEEQQQRRDRNPFYGERERVRGNKETGQVTLCPEQQRSFG
jgi:hypothetical protein